MLYPPPLTYSTSGHFWTLTILLLLGKAVVDFESLGRSFSETEFCLGSLGGSFNLFKSLFDQEAGPVSWPTKEENCWAGAIYISAN